MTLDHAVKCFARLDTLLAQPKSPQRSVQIRALVRRIDSFLDVASEPDRLAYYRRIREIGGPPPDAA